MDDHSTPTLKKKLHPIKRANIVSRILFCWLLPFFVKGYKKKLTEDDMYETCKEHESKLLGNQLEAAWREQIEKSKDPSLMWALCKVFKTDIFIYGFVNLLFELSKLAQPMVIAKLLSFYEPNAPEETKHEAFYYGGILIVVSFSSVLIIHNMQLKLMEMGMKMRIASCALIYRKALKLNNAALAETTIGQMVNLLSNDVARFEFSAQHCHNIWIAPLETVFSMWLLYVYVGPTGLIGMIFLLGFIPFQMYMGKLTSQYRLKTALRTDERVRLMNEIILGIQVIKMYTWEKPFAKLVEMVRGKEMNQIQATSMIRAVMISLNQFLNRVAVFLCIVTYVITGNSLTASYAFIVTSFHTVLRISVTKYLPQAITQLAETRVSITRIQKFLLYDEIKIESDISVKVTAVNGIETKEIKEKEKFIVDDEIKEVGICLTNTSVKWLPSLSEYNLEHINFEVKSHQLVAIVGPVGSGKSTLLQTILGELTPEGGTVEVKGSISYASQEPWVFGGSVRQNIIFGQDFEKEKYEEIVKVCALERDFSLFPYGDKTLVGERGVSLSGGQRARINLARAIYKDADIYLLDDPLSAVDTHVGKHLFDQCISGYLKYKCVVFVTHQLQYLGNVECIHLLEDGKVTQSGTYEQLKNAESEFTKLLTERKQEEHNDEESSAEVENLKGKDLDGEEPKLEKEHMATGVISNHVYKSYFTAAGNILKTIVIFSAFLLAQFFGSLTDYFVSIWVNVKQWKADNIQLLRATPYNVSTFIFSEPIVTSSDTWWTETISDENKALTIYSCLVLATVLITIATAITFFRYCMTASSKLHNLMFNKIVFSAMRFFNLNPTGRILNRFSKDVGAMDETLPLTMIDTTQIGLSVIAAMLVIGSLNLWILLLTAILLTIFYFLRIVFLISSRSVKRVEAITRSPLYTHLAASLQGLTTIRAFGAEKILTKEFDHLQDNYTSAYFMFLCANRTFGYWLDFQCCIYNALVTCSILFIKNESLGGNIGLTLTQGMTLTGLFQWGMRQWSELENQMTSVERIQEYADLEPEKDSDAMDPPPEWPNNGEIRFQQMSLKYASNEPYVLKEVTIEIKAKEKIGIVGRTGAGKSSLIQALFRLVEIDGQIIIDGVDTKSVPLNVLRSNISIIPQEPVLFSGTLRNNLDPFDEYDDEILWNALTEVELKPAVEDLPAGLDCKIAEGGSNFSVGQRQLVCLARALLRKNKILVMDEATANVDPHTDVLIQNTIREKFADCTVLTIAHRLGTIMDSDKVLVMDAGEAVEFNHPHLLLNNSNGAFTQFVAQTGPAMAENLKSIAASSFQNASANRRI